LFHIFPTTANTRAMALAAAITGATKNPLILLSVALTGAAAIVAVAFALGRKSAVLVDTSDVGGVDPNQKNNKAAVGVAGKGGGQQVVNTGLNRPKDEPWPPLKSLLRTGDGGDDDEIIGDVQFLLDFALVGHSKTATTAQMQWLCDHDEVQMYRHEGKCGNLQHHREGVVALPRCFCGLAFC